MRDEHSFKAVVKIVTFCKNLRTDKPWKTAGCFFVLRAAVLLVGLYLCTVYEMPPTLLQRLPREMKLPGWSQQWRKTLSHPT